MDETNTLIDSGPFGSLEGSDGTREQVDIPKPEGDPAPAEGDESAPAPAKAEIFKGIQRSFTDIDELSKYTLELERQTLEQQARLSGLSGMTGQAAPQPAAQGLDYKSLGEKFILDPGSAVQEIISHVRSSIMGDVEQSAATKTFYESFYDANEDLVGCEDLVDASVAKNKAAWARIPTDQAAKLLAADVRARAAKIRGSVSTSSTLLSGKPAHSLPSGGNPAPRVAAQAPTKPLSFADQMKAQQAKRKKQA